MSEKIITKPVTPEYEEAWDRIFRNARVEYCIQCGRELPNHRDDLCFICRSKAEDAYDIQREIEEFE